MKATIETDKRNFEVNYNLISGSRGCRDSFGCPEEPDENAGIEIQKIKIINKRGEKISVNKLSLNLWDKICTKVKEEILDNQSYYCQIDDDMGFV